LAVRTAKRAGSLAGRLLKLEEKQGLSLRGYYEEGLEVEFGFATTSWAAAPLDAGTRDVIAGGIMVLFDRGRVRVGSDP
jgi:hypothetical protein